MPYCCRAVPPSQPLQIPCDGPAFGGRARRVVSDHAGGFPVAGQHDFRGGRYRATTRSPDQRVGAASSRSRCSRTVRLLSCRPPVPAFYKYRTTAASPLDSFSAVAPPSSTTVAGGPSTLHGQHDFRWKPGAPRPSVRPRRFRRWVVRSAPASRRRQSWIDTGDDEQAPRPPGAPDTGQPPGGEQDHAQARSSLVRVDDVFHVEQVDGLTLARRDDDRDQEPKWTTHRTAERMIQESGVHVRHERGDRAFYNMQTDTVIGEVHHQVKLTESAAPDSCARTQAQRMLEADAEARSGPPSGLCRRVRANPNARRPRAVSPSCRVARLHRRIPSRRSVVTAGFNLRTRAALHTRARATESNSHRGRCFGRRRRSDTD